mgnify:CR=1 FL=1
MRLAERMSRLGTETAFEVLAKARRLEAEGMDVIHLEIGEPDFASPANVIDAGSDAIRNGFTHYNPSPGYPELRDRIAQGGQSIDGRIFGIGCRAMKRLNSRRGAGQWADLGRALTQVGPFLVVSSVPGFGRFGHDIDYAGPGHLPKPRYRRTGRGRDGVHGFGLLHWFAYPGWPNWAS